METPSSMRRVTRSQASVEKGRGAHAKSDRSVLLDITNDSPIVGLAMGNLKTPSSSVTKSRGGLPKKTPGSGEALLRGQVKTLLQKVEEESELVKISASAENEAAPFRVLLGHLRSPGGLLAPTPANTPQIPGLCAVQEEHDQEMQQVIAAALGADVSLQEEEHLEECQINRALLFDSPEKSEISAASSALTYQGSACSFQEKSTEDDCSSTWSIQVNASSQKEEDEEEDEIEDFDEGDYDECYEEEPEDDLGMLDDICEGMRKMAVLEEEEKGLPEFAGKHTRFVYNSDDEFEGEEEVEGSRRGGVGSVSPNVLLLKGLPVPEGKHLRFQEDEEEEGH